jgi:hypothetical protein
MGGWIMRREVLLAALANINGALKDSGATEIFRYLNNRPGSKSEETHPSAFLRAAISGYAKFMVAFEKFGDGEKQVLTDFRLSELVESSVWITAEKPQSKIPTLNARIRYFLETVTPFSQLLHRESDAKEVIIHAGNKKNRKAVPTKKITFYIREPNSPTLTLREFSSIIDDIENAFQTILKIIKDAPSDLVIVALDSGSEKSLDVVGIAEAVDKLSNFLLEAWDRIRFAHSSKVRANIKAASDGLSLLNELKASQEKGSLSPEEAEKLKRLLLKSVDGLFIKGVYTKEMQENVPTRPNQIDFQRTKLITHYDDKATPETDSSETGGNSTEIDELSGEE